MKNKFTKDDNIQYLSRWCVVFLIAVKIGFSEDLNSTNIFLRSGEHTGMFLRAEFGLVDDVDVNRYGGSPARQTYSPQHGINFGLGHSLFAGMVAHLSIDMNALDRGEAIPIAIISVGPGGTWYTPFVNTSLTGNIYYSLLDAQGGDAGFCNRWRFGVGKEILIFRNLGVGLIGSYEGGRWADGSKGEPRWDLSGVRLNMSLTYN